MQQKIRISFFRFRALYLKYLLRLMGLAGFSMLLSCTKYGSPVVEYGILTDDYVDFHGTVVSEDSLKPVSNINVKLAFQLYDTLTAFTDQQGKYSIHHYAYNGETGTLIFTDTDSSQNGFFYKKNKTFEVSFRDMNNLEHETDVQLERKP